MIGGTIVVALIVVGIFLWGRSGSATHSTQGVAARTVIDSVPQATVTAGKEIFPAVAGAGSYREYAPALVGQSPRTIIDFSAPWCSSCQAFEADIAQNMDKIPSDVMFLRADYDTRTDLRQKYGIRTQNTFVEVDRTGAPVKVVIGGTTLQSIIDKFGL